MREGTWYTVSQCLSKRFPRSYFSHIISSLLLYLQRKLIPLDPTLLCPSHRKIVSYLWFWMQSLFMSPVIVTVPGDDTAINSMRRIWCQNDWQEQNWMPALCWNIGCILFKLHSFSWYFVYGMRKKTKQCSTVLYSRLLTKFLLNI